MRYSSYYLIIVFGLITSCASITDSPKYQLANGNYQFRQQSSPYRKAFVEVLEDSVRIHSVNGGETLAIIPSEDEYFRKKSFDADVLTILFRYRPAIKNLPAQLNTNFNGNLYLGYRVDQFQIDFQHTPAGLKKINRHQAFSVGIFGGFGSTFVSPWTTNNQVTDEYDGVVLTHGFSGMIGVNALTIGMAVGWDYLTDRDKDVWIYQGKPWLGVTLGLNIN